MNFSSKLTQNQSEIDLKLTQNWLDKDWFMTRSDPKLQTKITHPDPKEKNSPRPDPRNLRLDPALVYTKDE